jgi:hypothetical protein
MRFPIPCAQCMKDDITSARPIAVIEFRDDGRYEAECPKGHRSLTILQEQKFEVLFDIGAYAIIDGYYREAVSSFQSSIERFYEFFVKVVLREKGIDEQEIANAWMLVASQSERQLGAFVLLYTSEFAHAPTLLGTTRAAFRNDVVHKGRIPTQQEATDFGQAVLDVVRPLLRKAKEKYPNGIRKTIFEHIRECRGASEEPRPIATVAVSTIISLSVATPGHDDRPIQEAIAGLRRWS